MKYKVDLPPASAKRLEKNRFIEITIYNVFQTTKERFYIPLGANTFEFEFEEWYDPEAAFKYDADMHYSYHIVYQNETGSREERIQFTPEVAND